MGVLIKDGVIVKYPCNDVDLRLARPDVSWPQVIDEETQREFGLWPVVATPRPTETLDTIVQELMPAQQDGQWVQQWASRPATADELAQRTANFVAECVAALDTHFDAKAHEKNYDNRITCMVRAGFAGPYQQEAIQFAQWVDSCNAQAYAILQACQAGQRQPPASPEAFLAELPTFTWPA